MELLYARARNLRDRRRWDEWHLLHANAAETLCRRTIYLVHGQTKREVPRSGEFCTRCANIAYDAGMLIDAWQNRQGGASVNASRPVADGIGGDGVLR